VFRSGDFLGEVSVVTGAVRTATVVADTPVITFEVDRYAFDYLVMHDPRLRIRMENLIKARSDGSWMVSFLKFPFFLFVTLSIYIYMVQQKTHLS